MVLATVEITRCGQEQIQCQVTVTLILLLPGLIFRAIIIMHFSQVPHPGLNTGIMQQITLMIVLSYYSMVEMTFLIFPIIVISTLAGHIQRKPLLFHLRPGQIMDHDRLYMNRVEQPGDSIYISKVMNYISVVLTMLPMMRQLRGSICL